MDLVSAIQNRSLHCNPIQNRMLVATVLISLFTQLTLIYVPFMQAIFQTEGLSNADMRTVACLAAISFLLHEGRRIYERRQDKWEEIRSGTTSAGESMV